ncbi:HAD hydrolase family protein [Salipaludibacillus sp. HK11]
MIEFAGLGMAMGNAPDEVKQITNEVTLSNDEDGVHYAIEKHIFGL